MKSSNQKKTKSKKKAGNVGPSSQATTNVKKLVHVGQCTSDYARSLVNPYNGPAACVPNFPATITRKMRVFAKGTLDVQTSNGIGWIVSDPNYAVQSNVFSVLTSLSTSVSALPFDFSGPPGTNFTTASSNSDYQFAQVGLAQNQIKFRVVSHGIRLRYTGTELNRGGQMVALQEPNHNSLYQRTFASVDGEDASKKFAVTKKWVSIPYRPIDVQDMEFAASLPVVTPAQTDSAYFIGCAIQAPVGLSCPFEYEVYTNFEIIGRNVRGKTPSHVDYTGFGAIHAVTQNSENLLPTDTPSQELEKRIVPEVAKYASEQMTHTSHVPAGSNLEKVAGGLKAVSHGVDIASSIWSIGNSLLDFFF